MSAKPPVHVLLMIRSLGHGGSERQLANTALGLDRSRFQPHVASVLGGFQADAMRRAGIPILHLPLTSYFNAGAIRAATMIRSYIRENRIRLVHTFDHTLSLIGVPVARTCPGVIVLSSQRFHMELVPEKYLRPLLITHRLAHGVVANCEALKVHLSGKFGYPEERIPVCYNGIDTDRFFAAARSRVPGMEDASLVVGTVCVQRHEKNIGHLLEAFARVLPMRPGMKLLIVGSGPEHDGLVARATALGIAGSSTFLPSTPDAASAMHAIDIFVHPSLSEGLPNGVMEAMACGCAVVASRVGGCPELIDEGRTGFLFQPGDLDDLTRALSIAIMCDEGRPAMTVAAAERMKDFSLARAASRMQEIYESYLG